MTRLPDWPARLSALVSAAHGQAFQWGEHDCCLWAADAVQAITGVDLAADMRGTYSTAYEAQRALHSIGGLKGAGERAGARIGPLQALAGDIGLVRQERKPMLAVCQGEVWLCAATHGLVALPLGDALMAWGVGHG